MQEDSIYLAGKTIVDDRFRELCQQLKALGYSSEAELEQIRIWKRQIIVGYETIANGLSITVEPGRMEVA